MPTKATNPFVMFPTLAKALQEKLGMRLELDAESAPDPTWCMVRDEGCSGVHCRITSSGGPEVNLRFQVMDGAVIQSIVALEFETRAELSKTLKECASEMSAAIS